MATPIITWAAPTASSPARASSWPATASMKCTTWRGSSSRRRSAASTTRPGACMTTYCWIPPTSASNSSRVRAHRSC
ncbi:hypothetical protein G6F32_016965 [Rhizopus arrhizus]|nr:hypothetical protein G6F32_016965 [Rhizopus arrhizus]